jgi:hypothetical protein
MGEIMTIMDEEVRAAREGQPAWESLEPQEQHALAERIAANLGYELKPMAIEDTPDPENKPLLAFFLRAKIIRENCTRGWEAAPFEDHRIVMARTAQEAEDKLVAYWSKGNELRGPLGAQFRVDNVTISEPVL